MSNILITTSSFAENNLVLLEKITSVGLIPILNPFRRKLTETELIDMIKQYSPIGMIAGVEPITASVLDQAVDLKVISRCGVGMDSVDVAHAQLLGKQVLNTPDAPTVPVAEFTVGLILALCRNIVNADSDVRNGEWGRYSGALIKNKTVGIIGCGRIGTEVGRLLSVFNVRVLGYDPFLKSHKTIQLVTKDELLETSDIITLHMNYSKESHHFLSSNEFRKMKNGAYVINAARGGLIDEDSLFESLTNGHLSGAALDCFENEPYTGSLKKLKNVVLSTHIASGAKEARMIMEEQALNNLLSALL